MEKEMETDQIIGQLKDLEAFEAIRHRIRYGGLPVYATGVADSQKCHFVHGIMPRGQRLVVTYNELKAKEMAEDLRYFTGGEVHYYPSKDIIFYSADVHSNDIIRERIRILEKLLSGEEAMVVLSVEALMDPLVPPEMFQGSFLEVETGGELDMKSLPKVLVRMGYERVEQVESKGQFAIRGGIVDLYPVQEENLYRIELFDTGVDSIRQVNPESQRSIQNVERLRIIPAREVVVDQAAMERAAAGIRKDLATLEKKFKAAGNKEALERLKSHAQGTLEKVENLGNFSGIESCFNYYFDQAASLLDYMRKPFLFLDEPVRIQERFAGIQKEFTESMAHRFEKGYLLPGQMKVGHDLADILGQVEKHPVVLLGTLYSQRKLLDYKFHVEVEVKSVLPYHNDFDSLRGDMNYLLGQGYRLVLLSGSRTRAQRLVQLLDDSGIPSYYLPRREVPLEKGKVAVGVGSIHKGFLYPQIQFGVLTETELSGSGKKRGTARKSGKKRNKIDSFTDLKVGDHVVHDNYGVGVFRGIETIEVDGISKDFIKLGYRDNGNLYISTNQLDVIQKYIGGEGKQPKLNKLGGSEWKKAKAKVRGAVEELAKDLVELYARRENEKGHAYGPDTPWQREFEEMFPYEETDDQLTAIEETKADMESGKIMDRLLCGDVGYGKTEVAIRAAFKAVQEGKQVAYLVPTTILAQQHYNNFVQRMKDFPIQVEVLSRFRSAKEQKDVLKNMEKGLVDIVIGTHRLVSKDVRFKDLGLLIIDEEQRFGVAHKEKIKKMKETVDVLTLTATPIPRTLHMSLVGVRDMSILEQPPQERQPIQTYVLEHDEELVKDAIYRELSREGQVYYVYNRVDNIQDVAGRIKALVPEAEVAFAHGQMSERELENIMFDFINGEIDVLVSTTIIETGLDIGNVNTIIIQDADRMGLSQLYQLRGRVGRTNRLAFAYLTYRRDKILQETAEKRLTAIREFTEFGSGFKIAMRDLEIRGAGNLLGQRQHGHMDAVGYDMYCKLLEEAVHQHQLGDGPAREKFETSIEMDVDAYIPGTYIEDEVRKIESYKKIAAIQKEEDYLDVQEELLDRYGELPQPVQNLLEIALVKAMAHDVDILKVEERKGKVLLEVKQDAALQAEKLPALIARHPKRLRFTVHERPYFTLLLQDVDRKEIFSHIKNTLQDIKELMS
ncbi:transcription-repair coupling factor [Anaerotalea alkaliphila]|uniref:Transcription-repair-coupling factor n=1 Tax=Anaerotalea alkaliphila TaxID=2662126 RepID=A0A7X5HTZ6_9FIRM|nr:transcription-repair coupling factor [Anaerotalea alkaliphila]NDL66371.1 transcription-repair coupling factor [Anaerotalea alkaliphila]